MKARKLVWHLYPTYIFLILIVLSILGWYVSVALKNYHYAQTGADLRARAILIMEEIQEHVIDDSVLDQHIKLLGKRSATRITIIRKDGKVIADSDEDVATMENHSQRPEIVAAIAGQKGQSIRFSRTLGQTLMYVALPMKSNGEIVGTVRTSLSVSNIDDTLKTIYQRLLLAGVLIAFLAAPAAWWLSIRLSRPLEMMTETAQRFSLGKLDTPLVEAGTIEVRKLSRALNLMASDLADRINREVEQRGEMEAILGCMVEGIIAVDNEEKVIRINTATQNLFGLKTSLEPVRPIHEVIRNSELQRFVRRALNLQQPLEDELTLLDREKRYLHIQAAPLTGKSDERIGVLIVLHDMTRLRQLESVRRDFVANVSHELKTPITAIRGAVETLLDEEEGDGAGRRFLEIIFKQSERLNALVEDLLDLSRIEQGVTEGGWELKPDAIRPVLEGACNACESLLSQQQIKLQLHCAATLKAHINRPLLEQAVINLLSNAAKYSKPGSPVIIEAFENDMNVTIAVKDKGCGIAGEHLPRLFERFYRIDLARSRSLGGTGLGLAIVKHIAIAHQGQVQVKSIVGEGSTFTIVLPKKTLKQLS